MGGGAARGRPVAAGGQGTQRKKGGKRRESFSKKMPGKGDAARKSTTRSFKLYLKTDVFRGAAPPQVPGTENARSVGSVPLPCLSGMEGMRNKYLLPARLSSTTMIRVQKDGFQMSGLPEPSCAGTRSLRGRTPPHTEETPCFTGSSLLFSFFPPSRSPAGPRPPKCNASDCSSTAAN